MASSGKGMVQGPLRPPAGQEAPPPAATRQDTAKSWPARASEMMASLKGVGTPHCHIWRNEIFSRYMGIAHYLVRKYRRINTKSGHVEANNWLRQMPEQLKLGNTGLNLDDDLETLTNYCKEKSRATMRQTYKTIQRVGRDLALNTIRQSVERTGVSFPLKQNYTEDDLVGALARVADEKWWKAKLRPMQWRHMEDIIRSLGFVSKRGEIYISDYSFRRHLARKQGDQKLLEKMEAENQHGQVLTVQELAAHSPSNPIVRRAELMVRMRGFENFAASSPEAYQGVFITLTCPSKFHATRSTGGANPHYNGSTVSEAQGHLNKVWQRTRAAFKRADITPFGIRVVEPHHDSTPHWHLLLFFPTGQVERAMAIFRRYAFEVDGDEPGADKHRLKVVTIDPDRGSATGYIAKYIAKNIDGYRLDADLYGRDAIESAARIEAWASIHGIHQFDQIGGASITVWRELRRLEESAENPGLLKQLIAAADNGEWETYNELMGGVICPLNQRPLRPMMIEKPQRNRYGEATKVLKGLWFGLAPIVTRINEWVIRLRQEVPASESEDGVGNGAAFSTAPPGACAPLEFCQ